MSVARVLLLLLLWTAPAAAQGGGGRIDVSIGVGTEGWRAAISHPLARPRTLGFVEGQFLIRASAYGGDPVEFRLRSDGGGLPSTLVVAPGIVGLNIGGRIEAPARGRIRLGVNLDLLGLAIGPKRSIDSLDARPATFSLFRYGNADRGSLNSEFYVAAGLTPRLDLRAGLSHYALGYRAEVAGGTTGSYQRFDDAYFVALRFR